MSATQQTKYVCNLCKKEKILPTVSDRGRDNTPPKWVVINAPRPGNVDEFTDRWVHVCDGCQKDIDEAKKL